jgi:hypothetical protein
MKKIIIPLIVLLVVVFVGGLGLSVYKGYKAARTDLKSADLRSHDVKRQTHLSNISGTLAGYHEVNNSYPKHTTCTPLTQIATELSSPQDSVSDTKADGTWPDYCYFSDASGTQYTIWAKAESDRYAGIKSISNQVGGESASPHFAAPDSFLPNAFYAQSNP